MNMDLTTIFWKKYESDTTLYGECKENRVARWTAKSMKNARVEVRIAYKDSLSWPTN